LIKLCGFIDTRDVEVALQLDVEAIGIVLARDARTPLTPTAIEELLEVTRGGDVVRVAVVGPMTRDECLRIAELGFDALQWVVPPNADDESGLLEIGTLGDAPVVPVFFDTEDVEQRIKATPLPYLTGEAIERTLCLDGPRGGGKGVPPSWERA